MSSESPQSFGDGQTVVILVNPAGTPAQQIALLEERVLSGDERDAVKRFAFAQDQHDRVVSRALIRLGLSSYFPVTPGEWRFARDQYQKPFVSLPEEFRRVQFSLSHTRGLVALLITLAPQAGVDVEQIATMNDLESVAERVFSTNELTAIRRLSGEARLERFFELWTLKEAYAKARGTGMSLPFRSLSFEIDADSAPRAEFDADLDDAAEEWQFWIKRLSSAHVLSAAVRIVNARRPEILLRSGKVFASGDRYGIEWLT